MKNHLIGIVKTAFMLASWCMFATLDAPTIVPVAASLNIETPSSIKELEQRTIVLEYFGHYNKKLEASTVDNFMKVSKLYGFVEDDEVFLDCIHQICLESQAKQSAGNPSGAMGIGQITPTTAFDVLHKMGAGEWNKMRAIGATSREWAVKGKYSHTTDSISRPYINKELRSKAIRWLSDENNNLILWGHMMSKNLASMNKDKAFLCYHMGRGGVERFKGRPSKHEYIVLMDKISIPIKKRRSAV